MQDPHFLQASGSILTPFALSCLIASGIQTLPHWSCKIKICRENMANPIAYTQNTAVYF